MVATKAKTEDDVPEPNVLEKRASLFLTARSAHPGLQRRPEPVSPDELNRIRRRAVALAILSGVVSGSIIGGGEAWLRFVWRGGIEDWEFSDQLPWWIAFFAFTGVLTLIEVGFLYWNGLDAATRINRRLGLSFDGRERDQLIALGLARAALESPNPRHVVRGVDPYALMPRWRLLIQNLLYKLKVGASSFILRVTLRRVAARAALRGMIPLIAVPLYAAWNAWITWRIVDETRLRAFGPGAIDTMIRHVARGKDELSEQARELILQGVGQTIMRGYDAHPNYVLLLSRLVEELHPECKEIEVDWDAHAAGVMQLSRAEQSLLLDILTLAAVLTGSPRRAQRRFLDEVHEACGRSLEPNALKALSRRLRDGGALDPADLAVARQ